MSKLWLQLLLAMWLLAGCKLTSTEVEPALPGVPLNDSNTVVYRANGQPIVANNSADLGTFFGAIFGSRPPVRASWLNSSSDDLVMFATDVHNQPSGYLMHSLTLTLPAFHGVGTYSLLPTSPTAYPATYYYLTTYDSAGHAIDHAEQYPVASAPAQVIVTSWEPATRHLAGTFEVSMAGPNNNQTPTRLSAGAFDLKVE